MTVRQAGTCAAAGALEAKVRPALARRGAPLRDSAVVPWGDSAYYEWPSNKHFYRSLATAHWNTREGTSGEFLRNSMCDFNHLQSQARVDTERCSHMWLFRDDLDENCFGQVIVRRREAGS